MDVTHAYAAVMAPQRRAISRRISLLCAYAHLKIQSVATTAYAPNLCEMPVSRCNGVMKPHKRLLPDQAFAVRTAVITVCPYVSDGCGHHDDAWATTLPAFEAHRLKPDRLASFAVRIFAASKNN